MKPWEKIDQETVPGGHTTMELLRRDEELVIRVDGQTLMSTRMHGSEDALAHAAIDRIEVKSPSILIGGLGMGFTARAALEQLPDSGRVTVVELVPAVVRWNEGIIGDATGRPLDDDRITVRTADIVKVIREKSNEWDAILLDVDNGPESLSHPNNAWLYGIRGLNGAVNALRPGGVLGIWSAGDDESFTQRLTSTGLKTDVVRVGARGGRKGGRHTIWLATKPGKGN